MKIIYLKSFWNLSEIYLKSSFSIWINPEIENQHLLKSPISSKFFHKCRHLCHNGHTDCVDILKNSFPTQNFNHLLTLLQPRLNRLGFIVKAVARVVQPSCCSCHQKNFGKPLEGFRERCRRFRWKIIHLTHTYVSANTYVCIGTYILKRWHIHAGVYFSYELWVLSVYFFRTSDE